MEPRIALRMRILDLKNDKSHQCLYKEALISICLLYGIDPQVWLDVNSGAAQHEDLCTKRASFLADPAFNQVAAKRRRLENYAQRSSQPSTKRGLADRPARCQVAVKRCRLEKGLPEQFELLEKREGGSDNCRVGGRKENSLNGHMDRWDEKKEGVVVHKGGIGGGRRRVGAEDKKKKSDVPALAALPVVARQRMTRPKVGQCEIIVGEKKETGKRKAMKSKEQPQATRPKLQAEVEKPMNVAASESPSPVIVSLSQEGRTCQSSPVKAVSSQTGAKETPILSPPAVLAVTSQTRNRGKSSSEINEIYLKGESISRVRMTFSNIENQESTPPQMTITSQVVVYSSSDLITRPLIEVNPSPPLHNSLEPVLTQLEIHARRENAYSSPREEMVVAREMKPSSLEPGEDSNDMDCMRVPHENTTKIAQGCTGGRPSSSPMMALQVNKDNSVAPVMSQLEVVAIGENAGRGEEIVASEVELNSSDPVFEGSTSISMDFKRILQKDTPIIDQEFADERPSLRPCCGNMKDAEQSEALEAIEIIQLEDISNIIENGQISHMGTREMQIPRQLQDSLHPLGSRAFGNITQVDSGLVRNTSMLPEMLTCILYPTNNLRSPSVGLDRCTSVIVKETMSDSKLLLPIKQAHNAMAGREEFSFKTETPFGKFARLCNSSDMLYSQGNQEQNYPSNKEESPGVKVAMEETAENTDTETPICHDVFQKTSTCRSSSFDNDADKQSAETGLETSPSAAALHVPCQNLQGAMENSSIHSVKTGALEGSYDIKIETAWSNCIAVRKDLNQVMRECEEGSWIFQKERLTSSMDSSVKAPSEEEEDLTSQMVEVTESGAEKHDESSLSRLKSGIFRGKVGVFDSDLTSFCQVEAGMRKREISCDASTNTSVEVSNQFGLQSHEVFTGGDISDLATGNKSPSLGADCQREVANDGLAKGVGDILKIQGLTEAYHRFSSTRNAVDSSSHDNLSTSTRLGPSHDIEMSQEFKMGKTDTIAGKGIECQEMDMEATEFECRKYTPSNAQWAHLSSDSSSHSENSAKCWGRQYPSENDYSHSLTPAGGILFDRKVSDSMDIDSKSFEKQAQERTGCFPSEEESLVEEENMDHPSAMNSNGQGFGSLTKKSTKNILIDSSKHNSPISTPGGRFFESISTSSTAKRPKKALMGPIYLKSTNLGGQASVKKSRNELQKRYGSSFRKKDSKTPNVRAGSIFANQLSPRISQKPSYTLCNLKPFIPLVQQNQAATSIMTRKSGKRDVKVKALEAAEVAKQLEERREHERKMRKELARRGGLENKLFEKLKEQNKGEKEGKESSIACSDINKSISSGVGRKKPVQSQAGTSVIGVDLKLRRAFEAKTKLEQENWKKLEEKKQKEEVRKKNAAKVAANKRKKAEISKKDREEKQRRLEDAQKQKKELEEQLRTEKEAKKQRCRALDDCERMRKAMEEEAKKQRRIEKERDVAERRRQIEENAKSNKFASKDAKHMQEFHQHKGTTLQAQNAHARKVLSMSTSCTKAIHGTEGLSLLGSNAISHLSSESNIYAESYEITPYKSSDVEDNDDGNPDKPIPLWARKENLIPHIISQQYIDPDEIFTGARTCTLNEVFETDGSNRRRDFERRSYSGEWRDDCFTWKEEYQYKLQMGYIKG